MLKFSRYSRDRSSTLSDSNSQIRPDVQKFKRQKLDKNTSSELKRPDDRVSRLKETHAEFEKFLDMVSSDLKEKVEKQKVLRETDKNYAGVQLFMLTKYSNRVERFRQVAKDNLNNIINSDNDKENVDKSSLESSVANHIYIIGKMKRRSKQILDISDKYAVEDIFDNINLVNECSMGFQSKENEEGRGRKMSKWQSVGVLSPRRTEVPVEDVVRDEVILRDQSSKTARSSNSSTSSRHSKMSTFLSLTDHLAVLTKTYTGRR